MTDQDKIHWAGLNWLSMQKPYISSLLLVAIFALISISCGVLKSASTATRLPTTTKPSTASHTPSQTSTSTYTITLTQTPSHTPTSTSTRTATPSATFTVSPSPTPTVTQTPTQTSTPTITPTPTITFTPTYSFPKFTALMQANCRYGPGTAYLYAYGLYTGDTGIVWGRSAFGSWLYVNPDGINYGCWVAPSVIEVIGDVMALRVEPVHLPHSTLYGPPPWVKAERDGNQVVVTWGRVDMTEDDDRGYMIEAYVCQRGYLLWMAVQTYNTTYTFTDETTCTQESNGLLYTVEKHGYTDPIKIPWP